MRLLLLGRKGQVGWELQRSLAALGELVALGADPGDNPAGLCGDLNAPQDLAATVRSVAPDVIVNAAAYTAVDKAEREPALAHAVNAAAAGVLAHEAQRLGAWLVHYSTDYVFDGSGDQPWREDDATGPLNVYGQTKLEGEQAITAQCAKHLIFRTSWVYAARGANFARTMLRLACEREALHVVDDQFGAPTGAELIADITAHAIRQAWADQRLAGTYHLAADGVTHWHAYAQFVLAQARRAQPATPIMAQTLHAVATTAFPTPARRPLNSRLDTTRLRNAFGLHLPHWQQGVARMLAEINYHA